MKDPLNDTTEPRVHWTTANSGEAMPGVLTPLSWSLWGATTERTNRETFRAAGAFADHELPFPPADRDRHIKIFYGRAAVSVDALAALGDRMPGTSGEQIVRAIFGEVPEDMTFAPTRSRYAHVTVALTRQNLTIPRRLHAAAAHTAPWWEDRVTRATRLDTPQACAALFAEAAERFYENVLLQTIALLCVVQPMYDAVTRLAVKSGLADAVALTTGYGGVPEAAMVTEIWRCSRGELPIEEIIRRFGQHGPREGELSGRVWREDDTPLQRMIEQYRARPDDEDPRRQGAARARRELERQLLTVSRGPRGHWGEPCSIALRGPSRSAALPRVRSCRRSTWPGPPRAVRESCTSPKAS
jgi:pyruvate,water dikinase